MILLDYSGVAIGRVTANLYKEIQNPTDQNLELIRYQILNAISSLSAKFKAEFGPVVIACDSRSYWRKDVFPYYKASRKKSRDKSPIDWKNLFGHVSTVKEELREHFPYRVVEVEGAEADDVIGCVTKEFSTNPQLFRVDGLITTPEPILVVSEDSDFYQLHKYPNVDQWSIKHKKYLTLRSPEAIARHLHNKLITGETGDGIPNALSDDDTLVNEAKRQKPIYQTLLESSFGQPIPEAMKKNYERNRQLIDFDYIPENVHKAILDELKKKPNGSRSKMFQFFVDRQLTRQLDQINNF